MKKFLLFLSLFSFLIVGIFAFSKIRDGSQIRDAEGIGGSVKNARSERGGNYVDFGGKRYLYVGYKTSNTDRVRLIANFEQRESSLEFLSHNRCKLLVNGGFYDTGNSPIGYFYSEGVEISKYQENRILNAVFSVNSAYVPRITRIVPSDPLIFGVQSGPLLYENGEQVSAALTSDKSARRVVAFVDGLNQLYFYVIYSPESLYLGPRLGDLGEILGEISQKDGIKIADAINLDGGSASVFVSQDISLEEINFSGSFLCVGLD